MNDMNWEGGIMQPEPDVIDPTSGEFDTTGLLFVDHTCETLARCPFRDQLCSVACPMLVLNYASISPTKTMNFCSLAVAKEGSYGGTIVKQLFLKETDDEQ